MECLVEMYGLPGKITHHRSVKIKLADQAGLADIVAALKREMPALEGEVIRPGEDRLTDYYALNINGKFYTDYGIRQGDKALSIADGDRIALMPLSSGG